MNFLIIGSGGREHSICTFVKKSKKTDKIYCIPGNAGTSLIAENVSINLKNFVKIKNFVKQNKIDVVIIGPEQPLVNGLVDYLESFNIKVFGPNKVASQLEGSKIFTKNLCKKYKIPTANFGVFNTFSSAIKFLNKCNFPIVVKADGLAAGKGVYICENKIQAHKAAREIFDGKFGKAKKILIEEFLQGEEMSFFIISDGKKYKLFGSAQDHKRALEGDKGMNTGGMGAYSPSRLQNKKLNNKIINKIIEPTLKGLKDIGVIYKGFLYAGLMIVNNEPFLIEYNVRMGDPECQTILPKLKTDLASIIISAINGEIDNLDIKWKKNQSLCIVLCSKGYPGNYLNNIEIPNLSNLKLKNNEYIFHAGTKLDNNKILSDGGRVLNFVICSNNLKNNRKRAIQLIKNLDWKNGFFRKDIAFKIIGA